MKHVFNSALGSALGLAAVVAGLALAQFAMLRNTMPPPDGIVYFEIADQIAHHGYAAAVPVHWAPLYPLWLLASRAIGPGGIEHELAVTAAADALALIVSCAVVALVFRSLGRLCWPEHGPARRAWLAYVAGSAVFLSFAVLRVGLRMPDALVTSLAIVTLYMWGQAMARQLHWQWPVGAGIASGMAFLARANLLHWSLVVAAMACTLAPRVTLKRRVLSFGFFSVGLLLILGPHTYLLSSERGHLVWGETGKLAFAVNYGAQWPAGASAWPLRLADGDVRVFAERHAVSFPGFYEPGREFDDAAVRITLVNAVKSIARASTWCLMGNQTPAFALMWPLFWAVWPALLFRMNVRRSGDDLRPRLAALLILAGAAGFAMHLLSFCNGYYLPPYFIAMFGGIALLVIDSGRQPDAPQRCRAAHVVGIGFMVAAALLTARYARASETSARDAGLREAHALAAALSPLPAGPDGFHRIAAAGSWLGLYGVRLSHSQVLADIPDPATLNNQMRRERALAVLRNEGVVALLAPTAAVAAAGMTGTPIGTGYWSLVELTRPTSGSPDATAHS